jgi:catalase
MVKGAKRFVDAYAYAIAQHRNYDRELKGLADQVAF